MQRAIGGTPGQDGDEVTMAFGECNLVDPEGGECRQGRPVDGGRNPAVKDTEQRIVGDIFLGDYIAEGAVDQMDNQVALVGLGMQRLGIVPVELLSRGRVIVAERAAEALGLNAEVDGTSQDGQMPQEPGFVAAVRLGNGAATAVTGRVLDGTLDGEDELTGLGQIGLNHADIGDVERNRDKRLLGHGWLLGHRQLGSAMVPYPCVIGNPYI